MQTPEFKLVIPARYASSRFPGKPLAKIAGEPMIQHVYQRARQTAARQIIVATDDLRIESYCQEQGMQVLMTSADHPSGTDRIAEVVDHFQWSDDEIVVGVQGDEPATPHTIIDQLASNLATHRAADIATLCTPVTSLDEYRDTDRVKVVFDQDGYALYFSRAPIPHRREQALHSKFPQSFVHIGLYAYRCRFLRVFRSLQPHVLEQEERLEQLRALGHGYRIHVDITVDAPAHGVDRPEDLAAIEKILLDPAYSKGLIPDE